MDWLIITDRVIFRGSLGMTLNLLWMVPYQEPYLVDSVSFNVICSVHIIRSVCHWFAEQVMTDPPLGTPSRAKSLGHHNEEQSPVQPPEKESHQTFVGCMLVRPIHLKIEKSWKKFRARQKDFNVTIAATSPRKCFAWPASAVPRGDPSSPTSNLRS